MEFNTDRRKVEQWFPIMMEGRDHSEKITVTIVKNGLDINFGSLTKGMLDNLAKCNEVKIILGDEVIDIEKSDRGSWENNANNLSTNDKSIYHADFLFI